ncbi:MAG: Curli production assembly/transport component CsgG [Deltaproteobacteria bacterium]|nr:Curli production assembly/transport component CsgG [Deltaproteobacteria bacterium]
MRELLTSFIPKLLAPIASLYFLVSCSAIDKTIHPDEKPNSPPRRSYEQILKENYKGPKAITAVVKFTDKSSGKEMSQVGDGVAEMLCDALLATKRYIVHMRKSPDDVIKSQEAREGRRLSKEEEIDILVEGVIREFNPGIPGAGDRTGGTSYVTIIVTVTDPRTSQMLATEKVKGKATEFGGTSGRRGALPEVFKDFSKTPMEKAIRTAVEQSASFIVAKTPPESYRIRTLPAPPKEAPKPTPVTPKVTLPPPPPPPLPTTQIVWDSVNLRKGPGTSHKIVGNVKKGTSLKILEVNGGWLRVRLDDGSTAWVSKLATSEAPKASSPPPQPPPAPPPRASIQPAPM